VYTGDGGGGGVALGYGLRGSPAPSQRALPVMTARAATVARHKVKMDVGFMKNTGGVFARRPQVY
jgi:hypothetical protein